MIFNARANVWDLGEMFSSTVRGNDDELDELDDTEDALGEGFDRRFLELSGCRLAQPTLAFSSVSNSGCPHTPFNL